MIISVFGLVSYGVFGLWLEWYNGPHHNEDYGALNYYYRSPVALFVALSACAAFKTAQASLRAQDHVAAGAGLALIVLCIGMLNIQGFIRLNDLVRTIHIGFLDTASFFRMANRPVKTAITYEPIHINEEMARFDQKGQVLFGDHWQQSSMYRSPATDLERGNWSQSMQQQSYGTQLCRLFYPTDVWCNIAFPERR